MHNTRKIYYIYARKKVQQISRRFCRLVLSHLFVKKLDHEIASSFRSSSQAATCYYLPIHSKAEANTSSALPKNTTSECAGLTSHYLFNAELKA